MFLAIHLATSFRGSYRKWGFVVFLGRGLQRSHGPVPGVDPVDDARDVVVGGLRPRRRAGASVATSRRPTTP
jgi:hypothetical protein